jgi:ParB family chromosome partitioning protein
MASADENDGLDAKEPVQGQTSEARDGAEVELGLDQIRPDPNQPRGSFSDESLSSLVATIKSGGLYQAILVRPHPEETGTYRIVAGHRRFRAHELAGMSTIRAMVRHFSDEEALLAALIENSERENLTPFEEAATYERFISSYRWQQKKLAKQVGRPQSVITEMLNVSRLPEKIKAEYAQFPVARSVIILIARLKSTQAQLDLWEKIKRSENRTVDVARQLMQEAQGTEQGKDPAKVRKQIAQILSAAGQLTTVPVEFYSKNLHEYRKLVDFTDKLVERVELLRKEFGEPPSVAELPERTRGRKPKTTTAPVESEQSKPMEPA